MSRRLVAADTQQLHDLLLRGQASLPERFLKFDLLLEHPLLRGLRVLRGLENRRNEEMTLCLG